MYNSCSINIQEIAVRAGVSASTVSRVLNQKPDVSTTTRARVESIIHELGYTPHAQAQRLASGTSRTVALLFNVDHLNATQLELDFIVGAAAAANLAGYSFRLMTAEVVNEQQLLSLYRSAQVDGIILMQIRMHDWRVDFLHQHNLPFVMIGRCANNDDLRYVDLDFEAAVQMGFEYLTSLGHRHIGFLDRPPSMHAVELGPAHRARLGYEAVCRRYATEFAYEQVELTISAMYAATARMLDTYSDLTAIFTMNGANAVGVLRCLQDRNIKVPDDFSVTGIASNHTAELLTPRLTAIQFPTNNMGYQATQLLIEHLENSPTQNTQVLLSPILIERASTGRVRQESEK